MDNNLGIEEIKEMAKIYKKETTRPLSSYQKRINEAAQRLCVANPALLRKRKALMEEARNLIIEEGFQFVKGKSRSKKVVDLPSDDDPPVKRQKLSRDMREQRMKDIKEDCKDLTDRIKFKEKRITAYENSRDYRKCDEVKEEITALKHQVQEKLEPFLLGCHGFVIHQASSVSSALEMPGQNLMEII